MTVQSWFIYLALVMAATSTPGPAVLFITTNSTMHGWRKAVFAALGNIVGLFCLGLIAITGLGSVLKASGIIFNCVKYAGAIYLVYLGLKMIFQKSADLVTSLDQCKPREASSQKIFLQALGVAVSNPKAIIFLTALFPQFVSINEPLIPQFFILISTLMFFSFAFLMLYALLAHKATSWLKKTKRRKTFSQTSGALFIGFGVLLATTSNK
ncbi:MAG: LysE family translocator [Desulfobulbaceae bacterium]|nr:LysE family translocator [Desulfobulbaceae bacterium]